MLLVCIVDDPEKGPVEDNLTMHLGGGKKCQHLQGDTPGKYSCSIHHYDWYQETPCFQHGQIGREDAECRLGRYTLNKELG